MGAWPVSMACLVWTDVDLWKKNNILETFIIACMPHAGNYCNLLQSMQSSITYYALLYDSLKLFWTCFMSLIFVALIDCSSPGLLLARLQGPHQGRQGERGDVQLQRRSWAGRTSAKNPAVLGWCHWKNTEHCVTSVCELVCTCANVEPSSTCALTCPHVWSPKDSEWNQFGGCFPGFP